MTKPKLSADAFASILGVLNFKGVNMQIPFTEDGHRKLATVHARDLYDIIQVLDFDEVQS